MTGLILYLLRLMRGGLRLMVDVYVALIVKKRRTIDQVPEGLRAEVLADLEALGLDGNGDPIE